jgi:predicted nucleotidyltransferase
MRTSIDHLPQRTRDRLAFVVQVLREAGPVEMIVLFGSQARGDWVRDLENGYESDYDLLVVTKSRDVAEDVALWGKAEARFASMPGMPPVDVIVHDFQFVNDQIKQGQYFFSDIVTEGVLLYTSNAVTFNARRAPTPAQRKEQAERDFERFHTSANRFFITHQEHLARTPMHPNAGGTWDGRGEQKGADKRCRDGIDQDVVTTAFGSEKRGPTRFAVTLIVTGCSHRRIRPMSMNGFRGLRIRGTPPRSASPSAPRRRRPRRRTTAPRTPGPRSHRC